jgi:hypothetical protein
MKYLIYSTTLLFSIIFHAHADEYQEQLCLDISKNIRRGDVIPSSCKEIFQKSNIFKQVGSKEQNLGVWIKNNMLYIQLETLEKGKWKSQEKFIGGKELSSGDLINLDISPQPVFSNTFEIHILFEEKEQYKIVTYLSSQKNGQKPRLAYFPKLESSSKIQDIYRSQDNKLWLSTDDNQLFFIKSYANSMSANKKDHPKLTKLKESIKFPPSYISASNGETLFLGEQQIAILSEEGLKKYHLSETIAETKFEIKDIKIKGNKLIVKFINTEKEQIVSIQTAAE